jgi:4-diphosphocytidyl-2-C-methyl-D-erythritol kinase
VAALRALNGLAGRPLSEPQLAELAAGLGADCALFAAGGPVIMRGRGDRIERLSEAEGGRLRGRRVLLFKPAFGIGTAWAYARMAAEGTHYLPAAAAEARLAAWRRDGTASLGSILYNNMEGVAFAKFVALPAMHALLRERFGVAARMSGSGSTSFFVLDADTDAGPIMAAVREAWGPAAFVLTTTML